MLLSYPHQTLSPTGAYLPYDCLSTKKKTCHVEDSQGLFVELITNWIGVGVHPEISSPIKKQLKFVTEVKHVRVQMKAEEV